MSQRSYIVIGATGLVGSAVVSHLQRTEQKILAIHSSNYGQYVGATANVLVNCNGNAFRFKANQDPRWDFEASVVSVEHTLFDFNVEHYVYVSTIDVYNDRANPLANHESAVLDPHQLDAYGFHKWIAERLVQRFAPRSLIVRLGSLVGPSMKKGPLFDIVTRQPVHLAPESTLSLVHTDFVAEAIQRLVEHPSPPSIVNITGTGTIRVRELAEIAGRDLTLAPGAEGMLYRYDINNQLLRGLMAVPSSREAAEQAIQEWARRAS